MTSFMMGTTSTITTKSMWKIAQCAPAVGTKVWCFFLLPAGCRDAANCRYYICSQAKNQVYRPRRDDLFQQFRSNFAGPTGTWVRLIVQNFTSIGAPGWKCGHKNIKNFHLLEKCRFVRATPLTDFEFFRCFYASIYPTFVF